MKPQTEMRGTARLLKAVRLCRTAEEFVADIMAHPHWFLCNDFLKRQVKPYFVNFFNEFKEVKL